MISRMNKRFFVAGGKKRSPGPAHLTGIIATSSSTIDITWTNPDALANQIYVQWGTDGITFGSTSANLGSSATSYTATGLTQNTTYYFRVKRLNTVTGLFSYSGSGGATTWDADAQAYVTFAALTGGELSQEIEVCNMLFPALKDYGLWTHLKALCLFTPQLGPLADGSPKLVDAKRLVNMTNNGADLLQSAGLITDGVLTYVDQGLNMSTIGGVTVSNFMVTCTYQITDLPPDYSYVFGTNVDPGVGPTLAFGVNGAPKTLFGVADNSEGNILEGTSNSGSYNTESLGAGGGISSNSWLYENNGDTIVPGSAILTAFPNLSNYLGGVNGAGSLYRPTNMVMSWLTVFYGLTDPAYSEPFNMYVSQTIYNGYYGRT